MKRVTKILKIIAILLNTIFLACILLIVSRSGTHPQNLLDRAGIILIFAFPAVTLITIALTFHKKVQILTSVLKVIAIIVNVFFPIILIFAIAVERVNPEHLAQWLICLMGLGLPVVNILTIVLTYRKEKAKGDEI